MLDRSITLLLSLFGDKILFKEMYMNAQLTQSGLWWLVLCVNLARLYYSIILNSDLGVAVKIFCGNG